MTNQQLRCSLLKEAISRGNVITVGIMAVNIRNSMQKKSIAALLYTLEASFPKRLQ